MREVLLKEAVELKLPAQRGMMLVIRLTTAGVIARAGLGVDRMDDVKMAVEEACSCLMGGGAPGALRISFRDAGDRLLIQVRGDDGFAAQPATADELTVVQCILESLVDGVEIQMQDGAVRGVALCVALEA